MRVLYFARARELAGVRSEEIHTVAGTEPRNATVADLLDELCGRFGPEFGELVSRSTLMVDDEILTADGRAKRMLGDEIAILPPVSGGDGPADDAAAPTGPPHGAHPHDADPHRAHGDGAHGDGAHGHGAEGHGRHAHGADGGPGGGRRRLRVGILTVSDRASHGDYEDLTGPALVTQLEDSIDATVLQRSVVPDEADGIAETVRNWCDELLLDLVVTNGGTGLSGRDVTPEAVRSVLDVEAPGLGELMRSAGLAKTPLAALSRQLGGRRGSTVVLAVPGSVRAATESMGAVLEILPHLCSLASEARTAPVASEAQTASVESEAG